MSRTFESSSAGPLPADTVLECGVCWWVYDPAEGDDINDIPPDTAFSALPEDYRCPSCDAAKGKFMITGQAIGRTDGAVSSAKSGIEPQETRVTSLIKAYEKAEEAMLGLPVHNKALRIEAVGFRPYEDHYVGVIVTPWCMNIIAVPLDPQAAPPGALGGNKGFVFPSGSYSFIIGRMDGVGTVLTCSLLSPLDMFDDPEVARATAEAAIDGLFQPPPAAQSSRRGFMTGQRA